MVQSSFATSTGPTRIPLWIAQAIVVSVVASALVARLLRRFTPLVSLLTMTLAFPDHAPSRFRTALRAGTARKLLAEDTSLIEGNAQAAAEHALVLVNRLAKHEKLTRGHTERVRAYADMIGEQLGLDDAEMNRLRWGTLLHDVGKLKVPPEILSKPGAPTDDEWVVLRRHPAHAIEMLAPLEPWLGEWVLAAAEHHERWDGAGYPRGLAGSDISLPGRITAVADAFDVITSRRSYKDPISPEAARAELVAAAGSHFDPNIVRAMLEAGLQAPQRSNPFGWLFELPGLARLVNAGLAAPVLAAAAVTVIAPAVVEPPSPDLALTAVAAPDRLPSPTSTVVVASTTAPTTAPPVATSELSTTAPTTTTSTTAAPTTTAPPATNSSTTSTAAPTTSPPTTAPPALTACELAASGQTELPGADLQGCDLSGLTFDGMNFTGANLRNADFSGVTVQNFAIVGADLTGADLTGASFTDGSFANTAMTWAGGTAIVLTRVNLDGALWNSAALADAVMSEVSFTGSNFSSADFTRANISLSQLRDANFAGADFNSSTLESVGFERSDLSTANFLNASFSSVTGDAAIHRATVCPSGAVTDVTCF